MIVNVVTEDLFYSHHGHDLFDLDKGQDRMRSFRVKKADTLDELIQTLSEALVSRVFSSLAFSSRYPVASNPISIDFMAHSWFVGSSADLHGRTAVRSSAAVRLLGLFIQRFAERVIRRFSVCTRVHHIESNFLGRLPLFNVGIGNHWGFCGSRSFRPNKELNPGPKSSTLSTKPSLNPGVLMIL